MQWLETQSAASADVTTLPVTLATDTNAWQLYWIHVIHIMNSHKLLTEKLALCLVPNSNSSIICGSLSTSVCKEIKCTFLRVSKCFLTDLPSEGLCVCFGDALMAQLCHSCSAVVEMVCEMQCHLRVYHNAILAAPVCIWLPSEKYLLKVIPYPSSYKI